jgi:hypothetical protein
MNKKEIITLIRDNGVEGSFFMILLDILNGKLERDYDETYANGFWDFTYDLGLDCDTGENEKVFESVYNGLWEIAESIIKGE